MDGSQFGWLTKTLATTHLTRLTALRGLLASIVVALTGVSLADAPSSAARRRHRRRRRTICHCDSASASSCRTLKVTPRGKRRHLRRDACDYSGPCRGVSGCAAPPPPPQCQNTNQCTGGQVCINSACVNCTTDAECLGGQVCLNGRCQQPVTPPQCQNTNQCSGGQVCVGGQCVDCTSYTQCGSATNAGHLACLAGRCRGGEACTNSAQCFAPLLCGDPGGSGDQPDICLFVAENCDEDSDCPAANPICVLGLCTRECVPNGNCSGVSGCTNCTCQGEVCLPTAP